MSNNSSKRYNIAARETVMALLVYCNALNHVNQKGLFCARNTAAVEPQILSPYLVYAPEINTGNG